MYYTCNFFFVIFFYLAVSLSIRWARDTEFYSEMKSPEIGFRSRTVCTRIAD